MRNIEYTYIGETPITLQNFLKSQGVSSRLLKKLKRQENGITRNGILIRSIDILETGDTVSLNINDEKFLEPNSELNIKIAFENDYLIIFDKPAGVPVHPSIKHQGDTLGNFFAYKYPDLTFRPINRLDRNTSGLCAVAKNPHSANVLQGNIDKIYYALVYGKTEPSGTINAPIARENESIITRIVRADGQYAVTHYKTICQNEKYSFLKINLETGRTHQIRVHFSHIGHALAGDELYGGSLEDIKRHALHCGSLKFNDIFTGEEIVVTSPISSDIKKLIQKGNF